MDAKNRAWSSNIMHAGTGILMGTLLSNAFFQKKYNFIKLSLALFVPIMLHGFYNFSIGNNDEIFSNLLLLFCLGLILFGWRNARKRQKIKKMESEDKVITMNFFNIGSSFCLNLILVIGLIVLVR